MGSRPLADRRIGIEVTAVPGAGACVRGPASITSAANSWPMKTSAPKSTPSVRLGMPDICLVSAMARAPCLAKCRSDPQMPQADTLTSTCPSPGVGLGTSSR
ncbi:Uncharacterised protein [Mycobacteroides abscessus subsp. abscessus]|nr:Uncharacterised protein [Mycobacteroides abscessus subsp. abscessus]